MGQLEALVNEQIVKREGEALVSPTRVGRVEARDRLQAIGLFVIRYGLVLVIAWIGGMKFTGYEANGIQPLVENSPLLGWMYGILSVRGFSSLLGIFEICIALMIAVRPLSPKLASIGSALAVGMFLTTLSFLLSTPGWEPSLGGFPALSTVPGQFLIKDIVLLGAAIWSFGEALDEVTTKRHRQLGL